jgi:hypothetical protein
MIRSMFRGFPRFDPPRSFDRMPVAEQSVPLPAFHPYESSTLAAGEMRFPLEE